MTGVAIVGAGPYGLSLAAHLTARGVEHRIFGQPMANWDHHMPNGMFLKSEGFASSIDEPERRWTLRSFCQEAGLPYADLGLPVPIETFRTYGHWFQRHLVPQVEGDDVILVRPNGNGFSLELRSGARVAARRVVVSSGISGFSYVPPEVRSLPPTRVSHTYDHSDFAEFRGRRIAIVGAGQSALETAALLLESGAYPHVIVRSGALDWNPEPEAPDSDLSRRPPGLTPLGASRELLVVLEVYARLPPRSRATSRPFRPADARPFRSMVGALAGRTDGSDVARTQPGGRPCRGRQRRHRARPKLPAEERRVWLWERGCGAEGVDRY